MQRALVTSIQAPATISVSVSCVLTRRRGGLRADNVGPVSKGMETEGQQRRRWSPVTKTIPDLVQYLQRMTWRISVRDHGRPFGTLGVSKPLVPWHNDCGWLYNDTCPGARDRYQPCMPPSHPPKDRPPQPTRARADPAASCASPEFFLGGVFGVVSGLLPTKT